MSTLTKEEEKIWESLCLQCGKCCHMKYNLGIFVIADPELICEYLIDKKCSVYGDRFTKCGSCIPIQRGILIKDELPSSCGYAQLNPDFCHLIYPPDINSFWNVIDIAQRDIDQREDMIDGKIINLREHVMKMRKKHGG